MSITGCVLCLWNSAVDEPHSLLILVEEELVALDLSSDDWPTYDMPYMCSLHNSAVTCVSHIVNVPETLWTKLTDVGRQQSATCSQRVSVEFLPAKFFCQMWGLNWFKPTWSGGKKNKMLVQWYVLCQNNKIFCVSYKTNIITHLCILGHASCCFVKCASTQLKTASVRRR